MNKQVQHLSNKQIQRMVKKTLPFLMNHITIPTYDIDDVKQEIYYSLLKTDISSFDENHLSHANLDTYCFRIVYNHFLNLRQKYLYIYKTPCNASCPFYVSATNTCCLEHYETQCPYYTKYQSLLQSKLSLAVHKHQVAPLLVYDDYFDEIIEDIMAFCKSKYNFDKSLLNNIEKGLQQVLEKNEVSDDLFNVITLIVSHYFKEYYAY